MPSTISIASRQSTLIKETMQLSRLFLTLSVTASLSMGAVIDARADINSYDIVILAPSTGWTALVVTQTLPSGVMTGTTIQDNVAAELTVDVLTDDDRSRAAGLFRFTGAGPETKEFWIDDAKSGIHALVSFHI